MPDTKVLKLVKRPEPLDTAPGLAVAELEEYHGLTREHLLHIYHTMYLSRALDDKEIQLKAQNKIFFQISGAGHEAILAAAGMVLRPAYDWFYPYSHGRQMPSHWGHKKLNIVSQSSPTGTQILQAVGCAEAGYRFQLIEELKGRVLNFHDDEVVYVSLGDGTTSEGEFWEALNTASNLKLPVVFLVEDNGYAISVPVEVQTAGGSISRLVRSFSNFLIEEVDGCDLLASYDVMQRAVEYARQRKGPALVHAKVIRPYSHSLSDDEKMYRPPTEREADAARDPVTKFPKWLVSEGHATEGEI